MSIVTYLLWPNPESVPYSNPKVMALLGICAAFVVLSFAVRRWRLHLSNPVTKRLSKSWASATAWFGIVGLVLAVARVEQISYVSMRLWWGVWLLALLFTVFVQAKRWRAMHYQVLPKEKMNDPREKYLPKRKK